MRLASECMGYCQEANVNETIVNYLPMLGLIYADCRAYHRGEAHWSVSNIMQSSP
jgi:hypothetical protein